MSVPVNNPAAAAQQALNNALDDIVKDLKAKSAFPNPLLYRSVWRETSLRRSSTRYSVATESVWSHYSHKRLLDADSHPTPDRASDETRKHAALRLREMVVSKSKGKFLRTGNSVVSWDECVWWWA